VVSGFVWPFFSYLFSGIIDLMINAVSNDEELNKYCLYILFVAVAAGLTNIFQTFFFGLVSERLVFKIRLSLFNKLMKLPVSFYDKPENTAGGINTKLATDAYQIRNMVSGVLGVMCLNLATIGASLGIGFYYSWIVTLIALGLSPLIAIVGGINMKIMIRFSTKSQDA
jgi:ABC-type multidrug transport system fused ATPase/permease subunit